MENASKALIIAGAILIAILLISVGILVMNSVNKPIDEAANEANSQAAQIFNSKFTLYEGTNKTVQDIKALCSTVQASNAKDSAHIVILRLKVGVDEYDIISVSDLIGSLDSSQKYFIKAHYTKGYKNNKFYSDEGEDVCLNQQTAIGFISYINIGPMQYG